MLRMSISRDKLGKMKMPSRQEEMEMEPAPEREVSEGMDLSSISDEDLLSEARKRGLLEEEMESKPEME